MEHSKIIKEKLGIEFEGLNRGEKFFEFFSEELNNLKLKKKNYNTAKSLLVFDKKINEFVCINVIPEVFQNELQNLYKRFVRKYFLMNYDWYDKFLRSISNTLELKFKLDKNNISHVEMIDYFHDSLTTSFLLNFNMKNIYEFEKLSRSLVEMFNHLGFDSIQCIELKDQFLDGLIKDKLIVIDKKNFFNRNIIFSLSDPCLSVVFGVTSMFLPNVFAMNEHSIKYNSRFQLNNLEFSLKNFKCFIENFDTFNIYRSLILQKHSKLLNRLDDYSDVNSFDFNGIDYHDKQAITIMYFIKLVVNEFCFQTLIMSCFESYYYTMNIKNILFSSEIFELNIYKGSND
ncbi:hypothetical protein EON71_00810 [bacterium]|nr:MAG: hypothetical protein EON71_00810 [bacterium]